MHPPGDTTRRFASSRMGAMNDDSTPAREDAQSNTARARTDAPGETKAKPFSALDDIPGLPPFDPDDVDIEPSGFDLIWDFVRGIFGRRSHDRAA